MIRKAKVFGFFPATYNDDLNKTDLVVGAWQNGIPFSIFLWSLRIYNFFLEKTTGEHLAWRIEVENQDPIEVWPNT
jgi:hypothetical protein